MDPMFQGCKQQYLWAVTCWLLTTAEATSQAPKLSFLGALAMPQESEVTSLAFTPDGKHIAVSASGPPRLYEVATLSKSAILDYTRAVIDVERRDDLTFTPDGAMVCFVCGGGSDDRAILWDMKRCQQLQTFGDGEFVHALAVSPDGRTLAYSTMLRVHLVEIPGRTSPHEVLKQYSSDSRIHLWEIASRKEIASLPTASRGFALAFSPNSRLLAWAGSDQAVHIWEAATGKERGKIATQDFDPNVVAFSPDGRQLASASRDHTIRLWDVATLKNLGVLRGHSEMIRTTVFTPDGKLLVSAADDASIRVWDLKTQIPVAQVEVRTAPAYTPWLPEGKQGRINCGCALSWDGRLLATAPYIGPVRLYRVIRN
jgi:WD40 repeat protein